LGWELQELAEDYILKYVSYAAGLSNHLAKTRTDLSALVRSMPLFLEMTEKEVVALCKQLKSKRFGPGDIIVKRGEVCEGFYLIAAGRAEMFGWNDPQKGRYSSIDSTSRSHHDMTLIFSKKDLRLARLARGDYFGEEALLSESGKSEVTVRALTPIEVFSLNRSVFNRLCRKLFNDQLNLQTTTKRLTLLRQIPLFANFGGLELKMLARKAEPVQVAGGEIIFRQGDHGDLFYIIESGKISVGIADENSESVERARLGEGEYFGEISLWMDVPRSATITAIQPSILLKVKADDFREMLQDSDSMKLAIERAGSRRLLSNERWLRQDPVVSTS
jgi:cAMP-dependent protein kinase regulator